MILLRVLARLTGTLLLALLALAGLAIAVFSIQGGTGALSLSHLASLLHLPGMRDTVSGFLRRVEAHGPVAAVAGLSGAGAVLIGLTLAAGALTPRRERLLLVDRQDDGTLAVRRGAAAAAVRTLAEQPREVQRAKAKLRPRRTGPGGKLRVTLYGRETADRAGVVRTATADLAPLCDALSLRLRARSRLTRRRQRVR